MRHLHNNIHLFIRTQTHKSAPSWWAEVPPGKMFGAGEKAAQQLLSINMTAQD